MTKRKSKKKAGFMDRNWNDLHSFKRFLEDSKAEKVVDYDGLSVTTTKHVYTLFDGQLTRDDRSVIDF